MSLLSRGSRGLWLAWVAATAIAIAIVLLLVTKGMLTLGLMAAGGLAIAIAMLVDLRLALLLSVVAIPLEDFVVFAGAGTLTKFVILMLAGSYVFHLMRGRLRPRWNAFPAIAWVWLLLAVASLLWAAKPDISQTTSLIQLFLFGFIIAAIIAERPSLAQLILKAYTASACVIAVLGVDHFFAGLRSGGPTRVSATEGQGVEHFSAYLIPAFVLLLLETLRPERAWWKRVALAGLVVLIITGMLVSGTRSAWLATLVAVVLLILPRLRLRQYIGLATICLLLVGITLSTPGIGEFVSQRATSAVETGGAGRLDIWKVGVGMLDQSPWFGVGYSNFTSYFTIKAVEAVPFGLDSRFLGTNVGPHSIYLSTAVDLGIVGICVFLAWMASLVLRIQRSGIYLVAIRATFVAYLVQGAYLDILNRKYFWLFLGLAEGCRWLFNAWDEVRRSAATTRVVADKPLSQSS